MKTEFAGDRKRDYAARIVAWNWRLRKRLPRITALARAKGLIPTAKNA